MKHAYLMTIVGRDRPGIIAGVTRIFFNQGWNLEDVSMTVLEGEFAMILLLHLPHGAVSHAMIARIERQEQVSVFVKEVKRPLKRGETHLSHSARYLVTAIGKDRMGIVYSISRILQKAGCNITGLDARILGYGAKSLYALSLEADVPPGKYPSLQKHLSKTAKSLKVDLRVRPVETIAL